MCNCGKNKTQPTGTAARAQANRDQADAARREAAARAANPSTTRIGPAVASGLTQTFSLGDLTFGSALERDAYLARNGR